MSIEKSFTTRSRDGKLYIVNLIGYENDTPDRSGKSSIGSQLPKLHTSDGLHVSRLGKGRYQIIETGVILESADPNVC